MRITCLILFLVLASIKPLSSQISFLFEGGANFGKAQASENELFKNENIVGYYLAATPKFSLTNRLRAFGEFQYSLEGAESTYFEPSQEMLSYRQHYIRAIPGLEMKLTGPVSVLAGLNVGYAAIELSGSSTGSTAINPEFRFLKRLDYGLLTGLNINVLGLNIAVKYNYGLRDLNDINYTDINGNIIENIQLRNRFLQVGVGYELGL